MGIPGVGAMPPGRMRVAETDCLPSGCAGRLPAANTTGL
mgnify:CR=1 FL=1